MQQIRGINQYQQVTMQTVSPGRMIVMLYEGALRFLERGRVALQDRNIETRAINLNKAQAIVSELRFALDHGAGATFTKDLESLYDFVISEINQAVLTQDAVHVTNAMETLVPLLEAWRQIPMNGTSGPTGNGTEVVNLSNGGTKPATEASSAPDSASKQDSGMKSHLCVAV